MSTPHQQFQREAFRSLPDGPWREKLLAAVPADKFTRPSACAEHDGWLHRPRVNEIIDRAFHRHAVVCLSASPGSGKSIAASQFIDIQGQRGLWYRLGREDRDPQVVLSALLHLIHSAYPGFRCPAVEELLAAPEPRDDPQKLLGAANALLHETAGHIDSPLFIALDDFQLVDPSSGGGRLLLHVLATLPAGVKCLCLSRHPMATLRAHLRPERFTEVGGTTLSLTAEETRELCRMFLQTSLPGSVCDDIHDRTYGWVRGVTAYVQTLERQLLDEGSGPAADLLSGPPCAERLGLDSYFEHHVVRRLEPVLRTRLCELCWLDDLSPELIRNALNIDDVAGLLSRLFSLGLLVRSPGPDSDERLHLHPLFADFLRGRARRSLPEERPRSILRRAAGYLVERTRYEAAADCLLLAGDYDAAETLLQEHGMELLAAGRFRHLLERLEKLPINRVAGNAWLLLMEGIALLEVDPTHAQAPLEQALHGFEAAGDTHGEMICLAQKISYHAGVDGAYFQIAPLLARLEPLHQRQRGTLDPFPAVLADLAVAGARVLTERAEEAEELLGSALVQAQKLGSANLEARVRIIRCHHHLQHGELRSAVTELERLAPCTGQPEVGEMAKAHIQALQCHYLALADVTTSFAYHRHRFLHTTDERLHRQTPTAPLLCRWAGENALRAGLHDDAWTEVENGLSLGYAAANPNLRSQFLLYRALLLALRGEPYSARRALLEAARFFERFGTGPFEAQRAVLSGATRIFCGDTDIAAQWLDEGISAATRLGARQILAGAHAYAAHLALELGESEQASRHSEALLALMREHRFNTWFLFEPGTAKRVLSYAASMRIQPETANRLARRLLGISFDGRGQPVPLLRMEMLGRVSLSCLGSAISGDHLSRRERAYVTTLAGADHQQIDRERLIEAIWPGSEHSSANIYVVRNRLKKSLQRDAPGVEAGRYFTMTGSVVRLEHSWVDASAYREQVETGLRHWMRGEHWQAECAFREADALWLGQYAPTVQENDLIREYRLELQRLTEQKALAWSSLLSRRGDTEEAESVLEALLRTDPINEGAVRQLFRLRQSTHSISAAEKTLTRYRRQLEAEQFGAEEIERTLEAIRSDN